MEAQLHQGDSDGAYRSKLLAAVCDDRYITADITPHRLIACVVRHENAKLPMERIMSATPARKKLAASSAKARIVKKTSLRHRCATPQRRQQASVGLIKIATTLAGAAAVSLAVALITPSVIVTVIAMIAGLIGSGLLVKRYG